MYLFFEEGKHVSLKCFRVVGGRRRRSYTPDPEAFCLPYIVCLEGPEFGVRFLMFILSHKALIE